LDGTSDLILILICVQIVSPLNVCICFICKYISIYTTYTSYSFLWR